MHDLGYAHSVEVYYNDELIGGLYGLIFGKVFCGESMISKGKNASKVALVALAKTLAKYDFIIDAQVMNPHLEFMGAKWKVSTVEPKPPRLILTLGGLYNGQ